LYCTIAPPPVSLRSITLLRHTKGAPYAVLLTASHAVCSVSSPCAECVYMCLPVSRSLGSVCI
jgi:hypothetical protein